MTTTGSSAPSNESGQNDREEERKKDDKPSKEVYISIYFSVVSYYLLNSYESTKYTHNGTKYESIWKIYPSKAVFKKGSFDKDKIEKSIFIDCSDLIVNFSTGEVDDDEGLMELMDSAMVEIHYAIMTYAYQKNVKLHIIIGSDVECQDLGYAMNFVCDKSLSEKIKDHSFFSFVKSKYASFFKRYENKGWTISVDSCCIYEFKIVHVPLVVA